MILNQKGEGKGGAIFGFAVFALVVYLGLKLIPVMIRVYSFEDAVKEECKFLRGRSLDTLASDLAAIAQQKELNVTEDDINMTRSRVESHQNLKVEIEYKVEISTPFKTFIWPQHILYEAPVFE